MSSIPEHIESARGAELTQSQLLLWTGQRMHPRVPLYNMALRFDLKGAVDPDAFKRAFRALVEHSDAFRTVIRERRGIPFQFVLNDMPFDLPVMDLSANVDPERAAREFVEERTRVPFDLGTRLFDSAILKVADDRWVWYLNQHHLVTDGWSVTVVFRTMSDLYERAVNDRLQEAPELPAYADYVTFERAARESVGDQQTRPASDSEPPRLYGKRNDRATTESTRTTIDLGKKRSDALRKLARSETFRSLTEHMALFNLIATVLVAWVHRVSGRYDVSIGTPSHNRPSAAFRNTIGVFIEIFPFSVDVEEGETFSSLYEKVRHEAHAFLRLAQPGTSSSSVNRGFNVLLNYIPSAFPAFAGMPVVSQWVHPGHGDNVHDFRLQVEDYDGRGCFNLHFDTNDTLFSPELAESARLHFMRIIDAMIDAPHRVVADVELVAPEDQQSPSVPDSGPTAMDLFLEASAATPDAVAVDCEGATMTYAQLERSARSLAQRLRRHGVEPGQRVGLCVHRSRELPVGILGIMLSGAAWVPLDPHSPRRRLVGIMEDAGSEIVVTTESTRSLATGLGGMIVSIDDPTVSSELESEQLLAPPEDATAYVLYTSGSTGRPKGVEIGHDALAHYVSWAAGYYVGGAARTFAVCTSVSFDLTLTSLFVPLVTGGRMVVFPDTSSPAAVLEAVVSDSRIEVVKLTPSHLRLLAGRDFSGGGLETLVVGGEHLTTDVARAALSAFGERTALYNEYGPTEATVGCTVHRFDLHADVGASVPIGTAIGAAEVFVVNQALRKQPAGVAGEICIGGPGVARGYLGNENMTNERFVSDPANPGRRLYRTGDRGRCAADGTLEFLGRMDEQIKIRGVRIEPGEIEHALRTHPRIRDAVAIARKPAYDERRSSTWCVRCGLPENYPGATFDSDGLCHLCRGFEAYERKAREYFRSMDELEHLFEHVKCSDEGEYDCLMLLSGGKDSTYALCRLVDMDLNVLAFTLDNGFISEGAKANIRRVVDALGVDHVFGETPAMNEIFRDSLERFSNVCNGCFKTIYTLGIRLAREKGISHIVTGLSRGQFFETRLTEELFWNESVDMNRIDDTILEARKAYHRVDDAVSRLLDTDGLRDGSVFDEIQFVDFYRYCDVELDEMLAYLDDHAPWTRPDDTGRSTNCLINDAGIFVHKMERGYHNYAFPYSWDVRIGHKTREQTLEELNDEIDEGRVRDMLAEVGYVPQERSQPELERLVAYYTADEGVPVDKLRAHLSDLLPDAMIPTTYIQMDRLPMNDRGKLDREALPDPGGIRPPMESGAAEPDTPVEKHIADIWAELLRLNVIGATDEFLDLGGTSLLAIQIIARLNRDFDIDLSIQNAFDASTVRKLAALVEARLIEQIESMTEDEAESLAGRSEGSEPIQVRDSERRSHR